MDVDRAGSGDKDSIRSSSFRTDVDSLRAERDGMERADCGDAKSCAAIRTALDAMVGRGLARRLRAAAAMRETRRHLDRCAHTRMARRAISCRGDWHSARRLRAHRRWSRRCRSRLFAAGSVRDLSLIGYFVARDQSLAPLKKARRVVFG